MKKNKLLALAIMTAAIGGTVFFGGNTLIADASDNVDESYILGDVDRSGEIDSTDYILIKSGFLKNELKGTAFSMADINFDGEITSTDYLKIKNAFITKEALDDTHWNEQEGKPKGIYKDFALYEDPTPHACSEDGYFPLGENDVFYMECIDIGESQQPDDPEPWHETQPAESATYIDEEGTNHTLTLKHYPIHIYSNGCAVFTYETTVYVEGTKYNLECYTDYKGENCGFFDPRYIYLKNDSSTQLSQDELLNVAKKYISEQCVGKTYRLEKTVSFYDSSTRDGYRFTFRRYVNNIKTDEYLVIEINDYGTVYRFLEYRSQLSEYDLRTFNVNDDKAYYDEKITEALHEMMVKRSEEFKDYVSDGKVIEENIRIEIDDPVFFYAPDGSLSGITTVKIYDKSTESTIFYKTLGFYASEKLSASK